jgi:PAS domain S-box-containing protein
MSRGRLSLNFFSNLNTKQKGLVLVLIPIAFELMSTAWLSCLLLDAEHQLKKLDRQREALFKLERAGSSGAEFICAIGEMPASADPRPALAKLEAIRAQLDSDANFDVLVNELPEKNTEIVLQTDALRQDIVRLVDKAKTFLTERNSGRSKHITFMRPELFSVGVSFQNLSSSIIALEKSAKEAEPTQLAAIRSDIFTALVASVLSTIFLALALAYLFSDNIVKRLAGIGENARMLASDKDLMPLQGGRDEIAELDVVLHDTATFIENARKRESVILDNTCEVLVSLDEKLKILAVNSAATRLFHLNQDDLLGRGLASLVTPALSQDVRTAFENLRQRRVSGEIEIEVACGDGQLRIFAWTCAWSEEDSTFACLVRDVTVFKRAERLKNNFISIVSHDLRTPLTSIGIGTRILQSGIKGPIGEGVARELDVVESNVHALTELMEALLDLDKLESGRSVLQTSTLHAFNIAAKAKQTLQPRAEQLEVKLQGPRNDAFVEGETSRLEKAITNIMDFALRRSPAGSTVAITIQSEGAFASISITDSGTLITPIEQQVLFERFSAATGQTSPISALSLTVARAIIKAHGGRLTVSSHSNSKSGNTTTFTAHLPLAKSSKESLESLSETEDDYL